MKATYWIVSALITVCGITIMTAGAKQMNQESKNNADNAKVMEFRDIRSIGIDLHSSELEFCASADTDTVTVSITNAPSYFDMEKNVRSDGKKLSIDCSRENRMSFFDLGGFTDDQMKTVVTVPEGVTYDDITIHVGSGEISEMCDISAKTLSVDIGSGDAHLDALKVLQNSHFKFGSGDIGMTGMELLGETSIEGGSGNASLDDSRLGSSLYVKYGSGSLTANALEISGSFTTIFGSGEVDASDVSVSGDSRFHFGSGDMEISYFTPGSSTDIELGSGTAYLGLTGKQEAYSLDCSGISGSVQIGESTVRNYVSSGGSKSIKVSGGSGNVEFSFEE